MKYTGYKIILFLSFIILIASCKSSKTASTSSGMGALADMEYLEEVTINNPSIPALSSKVKLSLDLNGKKVSVNGNLRMKKDDLIQISIVPMLGIEVARLEITKDSVLIIDRMNKQYVHMPISQITMLANTDLNYYALQSLFFNEVFLPGKQTIGQKDLSDFTVKRGKDETHIRIKKSRDFNYDFITETETARLTATQINSRSKYQLNWKYGDFKSVDGINFPSLMNISFDGTGKPMKAELALSRMAADNGRIAPTSVSGKYKQISSEELIKRLLDL